MVTYLLPLASFSNLPAPVDSSRLPSPRVTPDSLFDTELVRRFLAQDETAFVEIMSRYREKIFSVAYNLLRNHADAEEITQDTFIRAHRALASFRGDSSLATWLHRIALNLSRNRYWYFFRRRRQDSLSLDCALSTDNAGTFSELVADTGHDPAQETATLEFTQLVDRCMANLDQSHREILTMRNHLNQSYDQIAKTLGVKVGTVKSRIARARFNLRVLLAAACPEFAANATPADWFLPARSVYGRPSIACA
ncbi:MAG: sigma-70 family RNA polymerase sigma factor [Opitutaceae bacterium]